MPKSEEKHSEENVFQRGEGQNEWRDYTIETKNATSEKWEPFVHVLDESFTILESKSSKTP